MRAAFSRRCLAVDKNALHVVRIICSSHICKERQESCRGIVQCTARSWCRGTQGANGFWDGCQEKGTRYVWSFLQQECTDQKGYANDIQLSDRLANKVCYLSNVGSLIFFFIFFPFFVVILFLAFVDLSRLSV